MHAVHEERWLELDRAVTLEGDELVLRRRGEDFDIRFNGWEVMASRASRSEEGLARLVFADLGRPPQKVLIGGLGIGYTLRAALDLSGAGTQVVVSELAPAIVEWVRGPLANLARHPLDDGRVQLRIGGVADLLAASRQSFDTILLDTDNGPESILREANRYLYSREGVELALDALTPDGRLGFWSAGPTQDFERTLDAVGAAWRRIEVPACLEGGPEHSIYLARGEDAGDWTHAEPRPTPTNSLTFP